MTITVELGCKARKQTKSNKSHIRENCSHSSHFVQNYHFLTKLIHTYVQCVNIVKAKYQMAASKAVIAVDRPMYALS